MRYGNCMDGFFGHGMNYLGFGSHLFVGAFIILIVALLFIAFAHNKKKRSISTSEAYETLKMRYVNGEITEEEYQKMKKMIQ
ncbi:MAG: SHOCT domain-containing protein [Lachnospiraceae bacterium]|nr:SHOCT domain-containing protein [Lachnospiraceae bacterium]